MKKTDGLTRKYFECDCGDYLHTIIFDYLYDKDYNWDYLSIRFILNQGSFFRRLKNALKYLFGGRIVIDETLLDTSKQQKMKEMLEDINNRRNV